MGGITIHGPIASLYDRRASESSRPTAGRGRKGKAEGSPFHVIVFRNASDGGSSVLSLEAGLAVTGGEELQRAQQRARAG